VSGKVAQYEQEFAKRTGASFAVAFAFARTGLAAILRGAGLQPGDDVLLSPLTCKVVPLAILGAGLRPVYADIRADTLNLDTNRLDAAITPNTRAILFQRTYGNPAGADQAASAARARGLLFIEDCAQCMPGADAWLGDAAVFSNNPGKPLSAGSGGIAVVREAALARGVTAYRDELPATTGIASVRTRTEAWIRNRVLSPALYWPAFEFTRRYAASYTQRPVTSEIEGEFKAAGARIDEAQAEAGLKSLEHADRIAAKRTEICRRYAAALRGVPGVEMPCIGEQPLYWFPVLVSHKEQLLEKARRSRIEIVPWPIRAPIYPLIDVGRLEAYGYRAGSCPIAEEVAARLIGLPTHGLVTDNDVRRTITLLKQHT
jgi:dTDP-4-amino-4,6-dideoxygalactose transaminase